MRELAFVKTVAAAVICGVGATIGIALSPHEGGVAWLAAGGIVLFGFVVAAIPVSSRRRVR